MQVSEFVINPSGPFSFEQCLRVLRRSDLEILHRAGRDSVSKMIRTPEPILIHITSENDVSLKVTTVNQEVTAKSKEQVARYVHEWFDLAAPIQEFYQLAENDSVLNRITAKYAGLRIVKIPDLFEALSWAIIGQQVNLQFAYTIKRELVKRSGESKNYHGVTYYLFPQPNQVLQLSSEDLRDLQFSRQKIGYIREVAELMMDGDLSKEILSDLSIEEAREKLIRIRGVGNWTANYVMLRCLNFPDAFPIEDVGLHNALKSLLRLEQKPPIDQIHQISQAWSGWKGYATFYLWRYLQDK